MTHEQQAAELIEKFYAVTYKDNRALIFKEAFRKNYLLIQSGRKGLDSIERAKACAIICVDEIIEAANGFIDEVGGILSDINYWQAVKAALAPD